MKTTKFFIAVALAGLIAVFATSVCGKSSSAQRAVGDTLTMCIPDTFTYWGMIDTCQQLGWWKGTYDANIDSFIVGEFVFEHYSGFDIYSYWGGFTVAENGDWHCYSDPTYCKPSCDCRPSHWCDSVGSGGWIHNQWGVMARMGLDCNNPPKPREGYPYLVAFGSGIDVHLTGNTTFKPQEVWICNHPWPYYGNIYGDGFARPLDSIGDYFNLTIVGLNAAGDETGEVVYPLARFDSISSSLEQSNQWQRVDLTEIEEGVHTLRFYLSSSDTGDWGMNTAAYFCMDKLQVVKDRTNRIAERKAIAPKNKLFGNAKDVAESVFIPSLKGEAVSVFDSTGKLVLTANVKKGGSNIDLSKLPKGNYVVQHNYRHFPIKKVK